MALLRRYRGIDAGGSAPERDPPGSRQGPVLERGGQWRGGSSDHGHDHATGQPAEGDGLLQAAPAAPDPGMGCHVCDGCGHGRHVRHHGPLT